MAANIQLKWGLSEYTPRALKQYSDKEVRKEYTRLRDAARKRLQRLEKAGYQDTNIYRFNKDRYEYTKNLNMDQLRRRLSELADFIESPASTLKGQERIHQKAAETLKERGIDIGNSKQDLVRFGKFMEAFRMSNLDKVYDSHRVARIYSERGSSKAAGAVYKAFKAYLEDQRS